MYAPQSWARALNECCNGSLGLSSRPPKRRLENLVAATNVVTAWSEAVPGLHLVADGILGLLKRRSGSASGLASWLQVPAAG
jgi:hypothetical protein